MWCLSSQIDLHPNNQANTALKWQNYSKRECISLDIKLKQNRFLMSFITKGASANSQRKEQRNLSSLSAQPEHTIISLISHPVFHQFQAQALGLLPSSFLPKSEWDVLLGLMAAVVSLLPQSTHGRNWHQSPDSIRGKMQRAQPHSLLVCHWGGTKHPGRQHLPQSKSCSTEQLGDADLC